MNKNDLEKDFHQRFGNGNVHTCFVPILMPIIGADCCKYGGNSIFCALNCGIWICIQIRPDSKTVIEHTSDNIKKTLSKHSMYTAVYQFLDRLIHHFNIEGGLNILFHCDIPDTDYLDIVTPHLVASALIISEIYGNQNDDISALVSDFYNDCSKIYISSMINVRQNHIICINGDEYENIPIDTNGYKIICTYPTRPKSTHHLKLNPPLPLNQLKLSSISDKKSVLYNMTLCSQNAFASFKHLKNNGINDFFSTFGEKSDIDGCIAKFQSSTDIYFTLENSIDHAIELIDSNANHKQTFIISDFGGGAKIY